LKLGEGQAPTGVAEISPEARSPQDERFLLLLKVVGNVFEFRLPDSEKAGERIQNFKTFQ
jgi:hypothetical protein